MESVRKSTNGLKSLKCTLFLHQPTPQPRNRAPTDELENQPGIFERKDLLTQVLSYLTSYMEVEKAPSPVPGTQLFDFPWSLNIGQISVNL